MSRALIFTAVLATAACVAVAQSPHVSYAAIRAMEQSFDKRVMTLSTDTPFDLLGNTRGVYLGGYGAVFTTIGFCSSPTTSARFYKPFPKSTSPKCIPRSCSGFRSSSAACRTPW
jgi:hypothetical protein